MIGQTLNLRSADDRFEEAIVSYLHARDYGRPVPDNWMAQYPELVDRLQAFLADQGSLESIAAPFRRVEELADQANYVTDPGRFLGLEIQESIASGGMGSVFKAYQPALDRMVALKTVQPKFLNKQGLDLFQSEARLLAKCRHVNIVQILEFHPEHSQPYFLMEYVEGVRLDSSVRRRAWTSRAQVFKEVCAAVAVAHGHGIVHGDLKPANILVDERLVPRILDFGLARLTHEAYSQRERPLGGTPGFLAPEVYAESVAPNFSTDIYALGVTLYVVLTGVEPFRTVQDAKAGIVRLPMEFDPAIPEPLQRICLKAMEPSPSDRYQSAELLAQDLERYLAGKPVLVRPTAYHRELHGRVQNQLSEIEQWEQQGFISRRERDGLVRRYEKLHSADSPWFSRARRALTAPLLLRIGAWLFLCSSLVSVSLYWHQLQRWERLARTGLPALLMGTLGVGYLSLRHRRSALACLGSFVLLFMSFQVVLLSEMRWFEYLQTPQIELWGSTIHDRHAGGRFALSNTQIYLVTFTMVACIGLLLIRLRTAFFASWLAIAVFALLSASALLVGDKQRLFDRRASWVAVHYLVFAGILCYLGYRAERLSNIRIARPFYLLSFCVFLISAVALAGFGTDEWLKDRWMDLWEFDNASLNVWLALYSVVFFFLAWLTERYGSEGLRELTGPLYLLVPVFALVPLNLLFQNTNVPLFDLGVRPFNIYELLNLLACVALLLVGRWNHIQSFLVASLWGMAVWIVRVSVYHMENDPGWPLRISAVALLLVAIGVVHSVVFGAPPEDFANRPPGKCEEVTANEGGRDDSC